MHSSCATRDHVENVANRGPGRRSHDSDTAWKNGQRTLQLFRKQTFFLQTIAELFEGDPQCTGADRIERIDNQLILAARRVNGKLAARTNFQTICGTKTNTRVR